MAEDGGQPRVPARPYGCEAGIKPQRLRLWLFLWLLRHLPPPVSWRLAFLRANLYWPRTRRPRTLNEKMLWRILNDRRAELALRCDKLASKEIARRLCPEIAIPEVIWKGTDLRQLSEVELPERWVMKPNNSTGLVHIGSGQLSQAEAVDLAEATEGWLDNGPFEPKASWRRKWGYREAERIFFVEQFVGDSDLPPADFKFRVFGGEVQQISVVEEFFGNASITAMTPRWELAGVEKALYPSSSTIPPKPASFDSMLGCAAAVGALFDFIRVDLYDTAAGAAFGELTAYPSAGLMPTKPRSLDLALGAHWTLPTDAGPT